MKTYILVTLSIISIFAVSCKKDAARLPINCNGLVTDTLGTNDSGKIFMPTAFTPNNDGINDIIGPYMINISSFEFIIYDEQNNVVHSKSMTAPFSLTSFAWSSSVQPNQKIKYYYKIQATTINNRKIGECGTLYKLNCVPQDPSSINLHFMDQLRTDGFRGVTNDRICP